MKILLTSDLHYSLNWFAWLEAHAFQFDLVVIGGDLLNGRNHIIPRPHQAKRVQRLVKQIAAKTSVAICSGNHDQVIEWRGLLNGTVGFKWMQAFRGFPHIIADGASAVVGDLVVTTLPHAASNAQKEICLAQGALLRQQSGRPWLVVHHVPPPLHNNPTKDAWRAMSLLASYQPDFWFSGHIHGLPFLAGNTWHQRFGSTLAIVPGQRDAGLFPNHAVLDLDSQTVQWVTLSKNGTGTSENPTTERDLITLIGSPAGIIAGGVLAARQREAKFA